LDIKGVGRIKYGEKTLPEKVPYDMLHKQTLPIEDNSAEIILSQYSLEHVTNDVADFFLKECGFRDVYVAGPNQSSERIFRNSFFFEKKPNHVALTVEAIK
jgi:hypothetical protein